jgi:hypothetical protein
MTAEVRRTILPTSDEAFHIAIATILDTFSYDEERPWGESAEGGATYSPDISTLARLIGIPAAQGAMHQTGRLGMALDSWVAHELRRAGFPGDRIYPYRRKPYVLSPEVRQIVRDAPDETVHVIQKLVNKLSSKSFHVTGEFYKKQIDVFMGSLATGAELMVSTKSMLSSFSKNLSNRYEEFLGDAENLRMRFPLSTLGVIFLVDDSILRTPASYERLTEMLLRLRRRRRYDAAGLIIQSQASDIATWPKSEMSMSEFDALVEENACLTVGEENVPKELRVSSALSDMVCSVLDRLPSYVHEEARNRMRHR